MPNPKANQPRNADEFSWERWIFDGLRAFRRVLFRYDFGLPDDFWYHMERAAHELMTAGRIFLRTVLMRRRSVPTPEEERDIEIDWDS